MGLEDVDLVEDGDTVVADADAGGDAGKAAVSVSCSICLEIVVDDDSEGGDRGFAKLQCGHQFHLDCIGSAFNVKGVMQCPNCRKIEKGQWLYSNGCRPYPEFSMDDWAHDEDLYDLSYSETSMWCPFGGFTRLASAFDEGEFPTSAYHDIVGQHAIFTEHSAAVSSPTHLCPYIAYVQPVHPSSSSSSTSSASVADGPTFNNNQWNSQSAASSEMPNSYALPTMDLRYHTNLFPPSSNRADQPSMPSVMPRRPVRTNADMSRSGSYAHPFILGQSSASRAPSTVGSSMIHPYPGSAARARERNQALQAYFQQPSNLPGLRTPPALVSGSRRSNSNQTQMGLVGSSSDPLGPLGPLGRAGGLYYPMPTSTTVRSGFQEAESSIQNLFHHTWERDPAAVHPQQGGGGGAPGWGFHQNNAGSGAIFRQRHSSDRTSPSQGHYRPS